MWSVSSIFGSMQPIFYSRRPISSNFRPLSSMAAADGQSSVQETDDTFRIKEVTNGYWAHLNIFHEI
jgi:hypothetical protein